MCGGGGEVMEGGREGGREVMHVYLYAHINHNPHKPPSKNKVTICNHQADSSLYVWPDV